MKCWDCEKEFKVGKTCGFCMAYPCANCGACNPTRETQIAYHKRELERLEK